MRTIFLAMVLAVLSMNEPAYADPVYVMRHLQKGEGSDPSLSAVGKSQADALASLLATSRIKAIFATPTRRAVETVQPLARRIGVPVTTYDPDAADRLIEMVRAVHGPVLVVGHSNTVPDLVRGFGGAPVPVVGDDDYGTIYNVDPSAGLVRQLQLPPVK